MRTRKEPWQRIPTLHPHLDKIWMDVAEDESSNSDAENLELGLEDLEDVNFKYDEESGGEGERDPSDDETFIAMDEMYGFGGLMNGIDSELPSLVASPT
jgi:hypothetical protein